MSLSIKNERVPLKADSHGVVHVGCTRVTLDSVIIAFKEGVTAEEIIYRYPVLQLADVYSVLSYYLRRRQEIETYLSKRQQITKQIRKENNSHFKPEGIRDRLLARQAKTG